MSSHYRDDAAGIVALGLIRNGSQAHGALQVCVAGNGPEAGAVEDGTKISYAVIIGTSTTLQTQRFVY